MSNAHVPEPFRSILNDVREATQTLANCAALGPLQKDGTRMTSKPVVVGHDLDGYPIVSDDPVKCGSCKGTGIKHEWQGPDLKPVDPPQPCPTCQSKKPKIEYVKDIRLTFEQPPIPMREWDWRAMHDGDDEEPSRHGWGRTPEAALADLKQRDAEFEDSLQTEEQRLLEEYP